MLEYVRERVRKLNDIYDVNWQPQSTGTSSGTESERLQLFRFVCIRCTCAKHISMPH